MIEVHKRSMATCLCPQTLTFYLGESHLCHPTPGAQPCRSGRRYCPPASTHRSLNSKKTLARVPPPAIMDTSMARRKL